MGIKSEDPRPPYGRTPPSPATAGCSLQKPTGLFAYRSRGWHVISYIISIYRYNYDADINLFYAVF